MSRESDNFFLAAHETAEAGCFQIHVQDQDVAALGDQRIRLVQKSHAAADSAFETVERKYLRQLAHGATNISGFSLAISCSFGTVELQFVLT